MLKTNEVSYMALIASIIDRAVRDLFSKSKTIKAEAVEFLQSEDCEMYCEAIKLDYQLIARLNFENPNIQYYV